MSEAVQIREEFLDDPMSQDNNFHDQIIREGGAIPDRANDNDSVNPSDDPSPSAAKPVNNPVEGETDCQAPPTLSVDDDGVAADKPEVIADPDKAYTELHECSEAIKQAETGLENQRDRGFLLILNLYASLGFAIDKIDAYLKTKGKVAPRSSTVFPVDSMMVSDSIYPGVDRRDSSVASKITIRSKAVAVMRQKGLYGEAAVAFLKEHGGPTGIYYKFDDEGNPKAEVPKKTRAPRAGQIKKEPSKNEEQGNPPNISTDAVQALDNHTDQKVSWDSLNPLETSEMIAQKKGDHEAASQRSANLQRKIEQVKNRTDPESVAKREQFEKDLDLARTVSIVANAHLGIVERLHKMKVYADGELKTEQMPPSVVCQDVTTHAGFALMLVAVNEDGGFSSVANMTPSLDEFAKVIRTYFDAQA